MKKVILLLLIAAVVFSCKKNEPTQPAEQFAEVTFNVTTLVPDAGRDWVYDFDVPECNPDAIASYALMTITDAAGNELTPPELNTGTDPTMPDREFFMVDLFYTNGNFYTQSIKLPVAFCDNAPDCCEIYYVTEFYVYDADGTMIKAAPFPGDDNNDPSDFFQFVTQPLPVMVEVCAFEKLEVYIDVLCFAPDYYELFGFFWFEITEITIREVCFFGDVCIEWWRDNYGVWNQYSVPLWLWYDDTYWGYGYYFDQTYGIQPDMPAVFSLILLKEDPDNPGTWDFIGSWTNETWDPPGEGMPLCFRYADYDEIDEHFKVELYIYGPWYFDPAIHTPTAPARDDDQLWGYTINNGSGRDWPTSQPQHTWYFWDNALMDLDSDYPNGDGVIEFAWGNCVQDPEYPLPSN